jgi:hypothetical protein
MITFLLCGMMKGSIATDQGFRWERWTGSCCTLKATGMPVSRSRAWWGIFNHCNEMEVLGTEG